MLDLTTKDEFIELLNSRNNVLVSQLQRMDKTDYSAVLDLRLAISGLQAVLNILYEDVDDDRYGPHCLSAPTSQSISIS